jgi:hypothetical protein
MATTVQRMLHLKHVHFKVRGREGFVQPPVDHMLLRVAQSAPSFAQRHFPPPNALPAGTRCAFIDNIRRRRTGQGVLFDVYGYVYGLSSDQFHPDFRLVRPDINTGPITDQQGKRREILHLFHGIALGQALIIEYSRAAGGVGILETLLSDVFNQHIDRSLPGLALIDVTTGDLDRAIRAGNGVDSLSLKLVSGTRIPPEAHVAAPLSTLRRLVGGTRQVKLTWDSGPDNTLDSRAVVRVVREYADEDSPLERISIKLKDGGSIPSLETYRERRRITVRLGANNTPLVSDIESGLRHYLDELRTPREGWRIIDDEGNFTTNGSLGFG